MSAMTIEQALQAAVAHHRAGEMDQAEALYRQVLDRDPNQVDALHNLGLLLLATARADEAVDLLGRAVGAKPGLAILHGNLSRALLAVGQTDRAIASARRAVEIEPANPNAHFNLGNILRRSDQLEGAESAYRRVLEISPKHMAAMNNLGGILGRLGRHDEAIKVLSHAAEVDPKSAETHDNLGKALRDRRLLDEAIGAFRTAIALKPEFAEAHSNLSGVLNERGVFDLGVESAKRALSLRNDLAAAWTNLGLAQTELGRLDEAEIALRRAVSLEGQSADGWYNLANLMFVAGRPDDAIDGFERAIALRPGFADAHNNLGRTLTGVGRLAEAIAHFDQALAARPDHKPAATNRLYAILFDPKIDAATIGMEHRRWGEQVEQRLAGEIPVHGNEPSPGRRLRVGYLSPDLRDHVVGRSLLPLLREHDRDQVQAFCYSAVVWPDEMTGQLRRVAPGWRDISRMDDRQAAALIHADGIDILVELSLHTAFHRLEVMARKPAPVQVTYLGYCGTTGLRTIDYRLSDRFFDPPGTDLSDYTEQTMRLPGTYWCYMSQPSPEPGLVPRLAAGYVTFGSLNNSSKYSSAALELWAQVLLAVPGSRLLLNARVGTYREILRERFVAAGVAGDRIEFVPRQDWTGYCQTYGRIDVALDPMPYGGGITTCDALWMGVPVVSWVGRTSVGRGGSSILNNVGLGELAVASPEKYVELATALATDVDRLKELRGTLRQRMSESPLMNARAFARDVEGVYRQMWQAWCEGAARRKSSS
jgi:protein O-GlcNAc transferase